MGKRSEVVLPLEFIQMHYSFDNVKYATKNSVKYSFENLSLVIDDLKNIRDNILTSNESDALIKQFKEIGEMLTPYFPTIGKRLTVLNPVPHGKIYLKDWNNTLTFSDYRDINAYFDDCLRALTDRENAGIKTKTPFEKSIIFCRLMNKVEQNKNYTIIDFLEIISKLDYHKFLVDGQPKIDMIKNCQWLNKECNITEVQTSLGRCFRIVPVDMSTVEIISTGNEHAVNFVLDLYSYGSKYTTAMIFFRPHNQTEFSLTEGGVQIMPGRRTTFEISQIRQLSRVESNCGERQLEHFETYSKENCQWNAMIENVWKNCGCLRTVHPLPKANSSEPFCSLAQTYGCVRFLNETVDSDDCPDDCFSASYDIDISTVPIEYKEISDYLPDDWRRKYACLYCDYNFYYDNHTSPGATHFEYMVNELFQFHSNMMRMFWWKAEEPFLPAYLYNTTVFKDTPNDVVGDNTALYPSETHYFEYMKGDFDVPCVQKYLWNVNMSADDLRQIYVIVYYLTGMVDNITRWYYPFITYQKWLQTASLGEYFTDQPGAFDFPYFSFYYKTGNTNRMRDLDQLLYDMSVQLYELHKDIGVVISNLTALVERPGALKEKRSETIAKNMINCFISLKEDVKNLQLDPVLPGVENDSFQRRWTIELREYIEYYLEMYSSGRGYDESNLAQVETYFRSFRRHSTVEDHSYTIWNLLSDIGGALGLWIGATAVTLFEMVVVFLKPERFLVEKSAGMPPRAKHSIKH